MTYDDLISCDSVPETRSFWSARKVEKKWSKIELRDDILVSKVIDEINDKEIKLQQCVFYEYLSRVVLPVINYLSTKVLIYHEPHC